MEAERLTERELAEVGMFLNYNRTLFQQFMAGPVWPNDEEGFKKWARDRAEDADAIIEKLAVL